MEVTYEDVNSITINGVNINKKAPALRGLADATALAALELGDQFGAEESDFNEFLFEQMNFFAGTFVSEEFSIVHASSLQNYVGSVLPAIASAIGSGTDGSQNLTLTPDFPNWAQITLPARATKLRILTNIVANDCLEDFNVNTNGIIGWISTAYKTAANSSTSGQRESLGFGKTGLIGDGTLTIVSGGPTYAGNIGDEGTFQAEIDIADPSNVTTQVGTGGTFSDYYFIFAMQIAALVDAKTYKFKFELEYEV